MVTLKKPCAVRTKATKSLWPQLTDSNLCPISELGAFVLSSFCLSVPHVRVLIRASGNQKTESVVTEREEKIKAMRQEAST